MTIVVASEFIVGAIFQDVAITNDKEDVTVSNRTEAMSDHDRSSSFHSSVESLLHDFLTLLIQGRCCFIQNEDLWLLDQSPCNGYSLLLASGKFATLQATVLLEAFMECEFAIDLLLLACFFHQPMVLLIDEVHPVVADIISDEHGKLLYSGHALLQSFYDSLSVEGAIEFWVLFYRLTNHFDVISIERTVVDYLELISPLKVDYDIGPAGAILLRNFLDCIDKDSIVRVSLF